MFIDIQGRDPVHYKYQGLFATYSFSSDGDNWYFYIPYNWNNDTINEDNPLYLGLMYNDPFDYWKNKLDINIKYLSISPHTRPGRYLKSLEGIVVHNVGVKLQQAEITWGYFEGLRFGTVTYIDKHGDEKIRKASAHFIVDLDGSIIQCIPEYEVALHAGKRSVNDTMLGIEIEQIDYKGHFSDKSYNSAVDLVAYLCNKYILNPFNDLYRHFDITGKKCPKLFVDDPDQWFQFKLDVAESMIGYYDFVHDLFNSWINFDIVWENYYFEF